MSTPSSIEPGLDHHAVGHHLTVAYTSLSTRLVRWREEQLARKALHWADDPGLVLDLPCDAGRFWQVLAEKTSRIIVAADLSADTIHAACSSHEPALVQRIMPLQTTVLDIDLPDNCVDCIFCMDLFAQVRDSMLRMELLQEFHRVTRETVIVSVCIDGNLSAWQQRFFPDREAEADDYVAMPGARIEQEFRAAGFHILQRLDFAPLLSMRSVYILQKEHADGA